MIKGSPNQGNQDNQGAWNHRSIGGGKTVPSYAKKLFNIDRFLFLCLAFGNLEPKRKVNIEPENAQWREKKGSSIGSLAPWKSVAEHRCEPYSTCHIGPHRSTGRFFFQIFLSWNKSRPKGLRIPLKMKKKKGLRLVIF